MIKDKYIDQIILATKGWGSWSVNTSKLTAIKIIISQRNKISLSEVSNNMVLNILFDIVKEYNHEFIKRIILHYIDENSLENLTSRCINNKSELLIDLFIREISVFPAPNVEPDELILNAGYEYYEKTSSMMATEFIMKGLIKNLYDMHYLKPYYLDSFIGKIAQHSETDEIYNVYSDFRFILRHNETNIKDHDVVNASLELSKFDYEKCRIKVEGTYKHFKGNQYKVLNIVVDLKTAELYVLYKALYGEYKYYVRPLSMFESKVEKDKYPEIDQDYRFTRIN